MLKDVAKNRSRARQRKRRLNRTDVPGGELYPPKHTLRVVPIKNPTDELEPYRSPWRRDYARLIHSAAFRRLQGKTQLFPGRESDFFRNRLTHSLEVAQIAKSIALKINYDHPYFARNPINTDLVETAALAHDLGHPPFGHNGEEALDECMRTFGGFEGNAQTLRILAKLEKRQTKNSMNDAEDPIIDGIDNRAGLNLTFRTLAAVLKYDNEIPTTRRKSDRVVKGYYYTEKDLISQIKSHLGVTSGTPLRTIECSIMDIADDIAYSTYDLEDAFKADFLEPLHMLAENWTLAEAVAAEVSKRVKRGYPQLPERETKFQPDDVYATIAVAFQNVWLAGGNTLSDLRDEKGEAEFAAAAIAAETDKASHETTSSGYYRSRMTSDFVGFYIRSLKLQFNSKRPLLSCVYLDLDTFKRLEVLKNYAYQALIMSPMLKVAEYRGKDIVKQIFRALSADDGCLLMPKDFQNLYHELRHPSEKQRVICDFIAGMTDRYAVQFYGRLFGTNPETIFSPL